MRVLRMCAVVVMVCAAGAVSAQTEWVEHPDNPVLGPGEPGAWDEGGRLTSTVLLVDGTYHMWFGGTSGDGTTAEIGHATSSDGVLWTIDQANPVLSRGEPGDWDSVWLIGTAVLYDGTQFHLWYGAFDGARERIGHATSSDGSVWTKDAGNPVIDVGPPGSWYDLQVRPTQVIDDGNSLKMWLTGWQESDVSARIGCAESSDSMTWEMLPDPVLELGEYPGAWDNYRIIHPSVVWDGSTYHMWYSGARYGGDFGIGYAFSSDGIQWSKHRDNPVILESGRSAIMSAAVLAGSTFHMWTGDGNNPPHSIYYATSTGDPGVPGLTCTRYLPAAAYAAGAEGSFYETDLDLSNASDQAIEYEFQWLPRGGNNSEPTVSDTFTLGAGMSVRYANVLSEVFGLEPDAFGALALLSTSPDLMAMARIANTPQDTGEGSFGQAIPALTLDDFTGFHERRRLLFGTENADMRFNVGCLNVDTDPARVNFELYRSDGTLLGSESLLLMPFDNNQLNRIFDPYHPAIGYVDYWSAAAPGRVWCYGSVLDNVTSDPTTVPPQ